MSRFRRRMDRSARGAASIEYLGLLPILLLVAMLSLQALTAVSVAASSEDAARAAARAVELGEDPHAAAQSSLPRWLDEQVEDVTIEREGSLVRATVDLSVPVLVSIFTGTTASSTATFDVSGS